MFYEVVTRILDRVGMTENLTKIKINYLKKSKITNELLINSFKMFQFI